jgi:hypothetical protein
MVLAEGVLGRRTDGYHEQHPNEPVVFCHEAPYDYAGAADADRALRVIGGDIRWRPDLAFGSSPRPQSAIQLQNGHPQFSMFITASRSTLSTGRWAAG